MTESIRIAGERDEIDTFKADAMVFCTQAGRFPEVAFARAKIEEAVYWLRRAKEKRAEREAENAA